MLNITPTARQQIIKNLEASNAKTLRIGIVKSGCSGFMYQMDIANTVNPNDELFSIDGIQLTCKSEHLDMLRDVSIDYVKEGINSVFRFKNPHAKAECGCGESFTI